MATPLWWVRRTIGFHDDPEAAAGDGTVIALLKAIRGQGGGGLPANLGQQAMADSLPVVIASDQSAVAVTPSANALQTVTATIANGESLSGEVDLGEGRVLVGIIMPAAWTAAALTFQSGVATGVVANVYQFGAEVSYTVDASQYIALQDVMHFYGARYVRVRSGTAAAAVAQGAERAITLVTARR